MEKRLETKQMKLTKQTLKQIIKEELDAMLHEEAEAVPELMIRSSNSGEKRFWLKLGSKYYQLNPDMYKEIQSAGKIPIGMSVEEREVTNADRIEQLRTQDGSFKSVRQ